MILYLSFFIGFVQAEITNDPINDYEKMEIEGWTVKVNKELLEEDNENGKKAIKILSVKLYEITRVVPEVALAKLKELTLWVDVDLRGPAATEFYPTRESALENGFLADKENGVEFRARRFVSWSKTQPGIVMHELAHAYHGIVIGYDESRIKTAYENAKTSGIYDSVLKYRGGPGPAYGMLNHREYFAESSEAYFVTNDFYPFVRTELKEHDPEIHKLLKLFWSGRE